MSRCCRVVQSEVQVVPIVTLSATRTVSAWLQAATPLQWQGQSWQGALGELAISRCRSAWRRAARMRQLARTRSCSAHATGLNAHSIKSLSRLSSGRRRRASANDTSTPVLYLLRHTSAQALSAAEACWSAAVNWLSRPPTRCSGHACCS